MVYIKSISVFFSILILLFVARTICGQNSQKSIPLKLYTNFYFDNTAEITETEIGYLSPALVINAPNGNFRESYDGYLHRISVRIQYQVL